MVKQPEAEFSWWPSFSHPPRGLQGSISVPLRGRETMAPQWILGSTACSPCFLVTQAWNLWACWIVPTLWGFADSLQTRKKTKRALSLSLISFHKRSVSRQKNSAHLWRCLLQEVGVVVQVANCSQESGWGIVKIPRCQITRPHNAHQPHLAMYFYLETYCGLFTTNLYFMF